MNATPAARPSTPPVGSARTIAVAGVGSVLGAVPGFLTGSLTVFIVDEFAIDAARMGLVIATFFLVSALSAVPGSWFTERFGARLAMLLAALVSGGSMAAIAVSARTWWQLAAWLAVAGIANGITQPAGNLALARGVRHGRQGVAFAIKQTSIPTSTLLAGAAVSLVAVTVGWRWAYAGGVVLTLLLLGLLPRDPYRSPPRERGRRREGDAPLHAMVVFAVAAMCAAASATSLATFYVYAAVEAGLAPGPAGALLIVGSVAVILVRLGVGVVADRRVGGNALLMVLLLGGGVFGFLGLALVPRVSWLLLPATLLAFGAGWGWSGLYNLIIVRRNPAAPAVASGIGQTGIFLGGIVGPAAFGATVERWSLAAAWSLAATSTLLAIGCVLVARRLFVRAPGPPPAEVYVAGG